MTLEEVIKHAEEVAKEMNESAKAWQKAKDRGNHGWSKSDIENVDSSIIACSKYAAEHQQLAEWLRDYKRLLEQEPMREFTKEEAKAYSKALDKMYKPTGFNIFNEPSSDLISRQAVKEQMIKYGFHAPDMTITEFVEDLPSVNPQEPKTGYWILHEIEDTLRWYECDQCGGNAVKEYNYCHDCGIKMQLDGK